MPRIAHRYDLYLPVTFNDGRAVLNDLFREVERRLMSRFKGLTSHERQFPLRGIWEGASHIYVDPVIIMTVFDFRRRGSARFIALLKRALMREFKQLEILITELLLRVH